MSQEFPIVFALYPRVTQLDFTGPYEVFARLPGARSILASTTGNSIEADGGMTFSQVVRLADVDRCALLCVPGRLRHDAPAPPFDAGRPERARPRIVAAARRRLDATREKREAAARRAAARSAGPLIIGDC